MIASIDLRKFDTATKTEIDALPETLRRAVIADRMMRIAIAVARRDIQRELGGRP